MRIRPGQVIANRYVIQDMVGHGGMGRIYTVQDNVLDEQVALKTLLPQYVEDKLVLERFLNEARIARQLSHPNIVRVHDIGTDEDLVYISMEFLKGRSLREILERLAPGQRIPVHGVLRMFDALCAALDYAHQFTIHRDIKPENVMVLKDGSVKLMDFGISKLKSNPNLTSASMVMGTPHYMSPEQLKDSSKVDARADVYSLGVMLYEILTGNTPTGVPRSASETSRRVPPALDPIIAKCVDPNPDKRYKTAGELRDALRQVRVEIETKQGLKDNKVDWSPSDAGAARSTGGGQRKLVGALLLLCVLGATVAGLMVAEERRQSSATGEVPTSIPLNEAAGALELEFRWANKLMQSGRLVAEARLESYDEGFRPVADAVFRDGVTWQNLVAERSADLESAVQTAWKAVSCFWAVSHWHDGMLFIPPDEDTNGFFLSAQPVSVADFDRFSEGKSWRAPMAAQGNDELPMNFVTAYDAVACLAALPIPQRLPTELEWRRALQLATTGEGYFGLEQFEGNSELAEEVVGEDEEIQEEPLLQMWTGYLEWTSTPAGAATDEVPSLQFGLPLRVVGESSPRAVPYESSMVELTFRGVVPMPNDPKVLDALFKQRSQFAK